MLLLHDNAPVHVCKSQAANFLFRLMKKCLRGKRFSSDEEVKEAVMTWLEEQSKHFFFQGDKVVATKVGKVYWVIRGPH